MKTRCHIVLALVCLLAACLPAQIAEIDDGVLGMELPGLLRENFEYVDLRLVKYGTTPPGTCTVGQVFFDTDASPGQNVYGCSSTNTWTLQGGGGTLEIEDSGGVVGIQPKLRFTADTGVTMAVTEGSGRIEVHTGIDTALLLTRSQAQTGADLLVAPASGSGSAYVASMSPPLAAYSSNQLLHFKPDSNCAAGSITINIDSQGAKALKQADGSTDPGSGGCVAGRMYPIWYDGTVFRLVQAPSGGGGGPVGFGDLTGVPSDNTSLASALNSKASSSHTHSAAETTSGTFDAARLPLPTTSTIGGVKRNTGSVGEFVNGVDASGNLLYGTPAGGGGGGDGYDPMDMSVVYLVDDFVGYSFYSGSAQKVGQLGWKAASATTMGAVGPEAGRYGVFRISTSAVDDNKSLTDLSGAAILTAASLTDRTGWEHIFEVRPVSANARYVVGLGVPDFWNNKEGVYLEYDSDTDTNWQFVRCSASASPTRVDTGIAFVPNQWRVFRVFSDSLGGVKMAADSTVSSQITTGLPTNNLTPLLVVYAREAAVKDLHIDRYAARLVR